MNNRYRVWCKKTKRFIQDDEDYENRENRYVGYYALTPDGDICFFESTEGGMDVTVRESVEICFSTGLKDKNGKEIYEGDIVRAVGEISQIVEIKYIIKTCGGNLFSGFEGVDFGTSNVEIEIIGNIYENPEILKK